MTTSDNSIPYVLTGSIFYMFGLKWCYEYAKFWVSPKRRSEEKTGKFERLKISCENLLTSHPIEGSLKLIATAIGLAGTMTGGLADDGIVSPKVVHATIYLFFAFSGLVDVLNFYFPQNVTSGLTNLALAQSFFVEGFLFVWASVEGSASVNIILAAVVWTTALAVALELVWPELKLLRGCTTLIQGGWIALMMRMYQNRTSHVERIALAFSWHVAAAFAVTLCVVAITRSCMPRLIIEEPPEIPIYDYCHVPNQEI